ncbi:MAG: VWA domain-containing protein [Ferrovibrio sp.]|uniref:VWA domain-containing protein n=1 Tax=Ferrovibrio sp. TaxID=1917215 RepID=UPI0026385AE3|nr:VWA domain-containing protein [Ferrovibrio sp.]MCW0232127.1 VWA domain-containing protein [Ferrovibrio sp.]
MPTRASTHEVEAFLRQVALSPRAAPAADGRGRLVFAMDATASRRATWDEAQRIQAEMFRTTAALGGLDIQLVFFRGLGECKASAWVSEANAMLRLMRQVECVGGHTQVERVLKHTLAEGRERRINALVYVGDCLEESPDDVAMRAGELGLLGVPIFAFQEGAEPRARACFQDMARLTRGAYCSFDASSAATLRELLSAVAVYAAGGYRALENFAAGSGREVRALIGQMR